MDNIDGIYNNYVQSLFKMPFDEIIKTYNNSYFSWKNFENIFLKMYNLLLNSSNEKELITNYLMFTFIYLNYTNYLNYSTHPDFNNPQIYKIINKIKYNKNILTKLLKLNPNSKIKNIIKITNPFVNIQSKIHKFNNSTYFNKFLDEYLINSKQMEKLSEMSNDSFKKSLNIMIFRNMICKKNNYSNYSEFYIQNIIDKKNLNILLDFNTFMGKISSSRKLLDIKTNSANFNINIQISEIINFLSQKLEFIQFEILKNKIIITNIKFGGKIYITIDPKINNIEFHNYQTNYSMIYYNTPELKHFNFLNKTSTSVEIKINSTNIKDYSSLLDIIHLLTISIKMLESYPNDIYDCLYPIDYTNYYFLSYCMFFEFVKPQITTSLGLNKFIIDLFKYYYIYSYYDYYFYHTNNLINGIMESYNFKNNIFEDFINNLKNTLKVPKELFAYPPFFDISDDLNSLIYYSFEIPSYFKLFDFVNAICYVFDKDYYQSNNKNFNFDQIITKYFITWSDEPNFIKNKSNNLKKNQNDIISSDSLIDTQISEKPNLKKQTKKTNNSSTSFNSYSYNSSDSESESDSNTEDDLKSRLNRDQISKLSKKEKKLIHNTNTYIELNIENSVNYGLDTDK